MPNLLFDKHEQTKNIILHPMAIWKCKDKVKTTNITLNKVKHNCGFIDFLNALLDMIIDKKNADYRLKIISKIGIDIESNRAKEEIKHYETNNIIKAICSINELKKKIYYSSLSQDYKKDSLYQLDIFIQKLEFGVLLSKSEYIYIENLERLVSD
jgi:hypothetical protein